MLTVRSLSAVAIVFAAVAALPFAGCSSSSAQGDPCKGGVVLSDGTCAAKCTPDKCLTGNACVANRCELVCASRRDCAPDGSQECIAAIEDATGKPVYTCQTAPDPTGVGSACVSHLDCLSTQNCVADASGNATCQPSPTGADVGKPCPKGTECPPALLCVSSGAGDADAYCTNYDCKTDDDCEGGAYCGIRRDAHPECGATSVVEHDKYCGATTEACVDSTMLSAGGKSYVEGPFCLERHVCLKRKQCAPCKTDRDCSRLDGQKCATIGGEQRCAHACATDADCESDATCTASVCTPKAGACHGKGGFCEPCLNDLDCGSKGGTYGCSRVANTMRACLDVSFPVTCTADTDCPKAPSGKHGTCLTEAQHLAPGDALYHKCVFPIDATTNKASCW